MDRFNKILLNAVVLTGILFCSVIFAQEKTTNDGVFTEAQVVAGEPVYTSSCGTCHDLKFYDFTFRSWMGKPLLDFWYHILAEMPSDNPGSFYDDEYTTVIAYILSELGYPSGDVALDPENGMDLIKFAPLQLKEMKARVRVYLGLRYVHQIPCTNRDTVKSQPAFLRFLASKPSLSRFIT